MLDIYKIKDFRKKLGITQKQLAKLAGVSQSLIAKIESNRIDPAYSKVQAILNALENVSHKSTTVVLAKDIMTRLVIYVTPQDKLEKAIHIMRSKSISQLPVFSGSNSVGSINDEKFMDWIEKYGNNLSKIKVGEVMVESFPSIPQTANLEIITSILRHYSAVLVKDDTVKGIITKADLIKVVSH
jgi:predicted transcriptional regulator